MNRIENPQERNRDPNNGFEYLWQSGEESRGKYSLLIVPDSIPSKLVYQKPALGIDIELAPKYNNHRWQVAGSLDGDTIENLDLQVTQKRRGPNPPIVTELDLDEIRRYGDVDHDQENEGNFEGDLHLPVNNIYKFLRKVWRPVAQTKDFPEQVPNYNLGGPNINYKILPQKEILDRRRPERNVTLLVERITKTT